LSLKEPGKTIDVIAMNKEDFANWTDGFRILISNKIENQETLDDWKFLTSLELRTHLLELEGLEVPNEPPKLPPLPENFNFCTN